MKHIRTLFILAHVAVSGGVSAQNGATSIALPVPSEPPASITLELEFDDRTIRADLEQHSLRDERTTVRSYLGADRWAVEPPPPVRTYRGSIAGLPSATVIASLAKDGWTLDIIESNEMHWRVSPDAHGVPGVHRAAVVEPNNPMLPCGVTGDMIQPLESIYSSDSSDPSARHISGITCLQQAQIAFDADFEYFQAKGSVAATVASIDAHMNIVDFFYARDVQITYELTDYVVRAAPFYVPTGWRPPARSIQVGMEYQPDLRCPRHGPPHDRQAGLADRIWRIGVGWRGVYE
jgi:hypothetical protein